LNDEEYMRLALDEARRAYNMGEVPIGSIIVSAQGDVVARAHNLREALQDPTAHAELLAIRQAGSATGSWRLSGTTLYVTIEPCPMCAGALVLARIKRLVYGADDPKAGAVSSLFNLVRDPRLNHQLEVTKGVLAREAGELLRRFFRRLRD